MQISQQTIDEANTELRKARRNLRKATSLKEAKEAARRVVDLKTTDAETSPVEYDDYLWPADRESQARISELIRQGERKDGWAYQARAVGSGIVEVGVDDLKTIAEAYTDQIDAAREWAAAQLERISESESMEDLKGLSFE